jgi:hypothetical protein
MPAAVRRMPLVTVAAGAIRAVTAAAVVLAAVLAAAPPATAALPATAAAADPPRPSDYRSTITRVHPTTDAVEVSVTGGDAVLELRTEPGHEALVLGYDGEPYLRFRPDGAVEANLESPATYVNASLSGTAEVPPDVDAGDPPRWRRVAGGGAYAWHDHRVHWMGSQPPPGIDRGDEVRRWTVPLRVDDRPVTVDGVLAFAPAVAWWPWPVVVTGVGASVWMLGRRLSRPLAVATLAAGGACVVAAALAAAEQLSIPAELGRSPLRVVVPAGGALAAMGALVLLLVGRGRHVPLARNLGLAAVAAAAGWGLLRLAVFTKPVLVTDLAPGLDRAGTAGVLGLSLAAAALAVRT